MLLSFARASGKWIAAKRFASSYKEKSFKENWLTDAGAYPILAILGLAIILPAVAGTIIMVRSPDNRFFKPDRKQIFRGDIMDDDKPWKDNRRDAANNDEAKQSKK